MAFKNDVKTANAGGADVVLFTCPAGAEASIHTLFLDAQGGSAAATLKLTLQSTGQTVTFLDGYALTDDGPFTFPKPINMTAGDTLSLSAATSNIVALISAFQDDNGGTSASFNVRGTYDNAATYDKLDVVTLNGTSFVAVADGVIGSTPPSTNWMVLAAKGDQGDVANTRLVNTGDGLTGGGDLSADRTLAVDGTVARLNAAQTFTANQIVNGEFVANSYNETFVTLSGTTPTVNCEAGNSFTITLSGNTTFTFSNPPASGTAFGFTLKIVQDAGASGYTVTWPASVDYAGATAPTLTADADAVDVLVFYTHDGGTTFFGFVAGQAMA